VESIVTSIHRIGSLSGKQIIGLVSGIIAFIMPVMLAADVAMGLTNLNTATWLMIWALDLVGLALVIRGGNKLPALQVAWAIAATLIVLALIYRNNAWVWRWSEIGALVGCAAATLAWWRRAEKQGLYFYFAASVISFYPQFEDYFVHPAPETWYVWTFSAFACALSYLSAEKRDMAHLGTPAFFFCFNVVVLIMVLR